MLNMVFRSGARMRTVARAREVQRGLCSGSGTGTGTGAGGDKGKGPLRRLLDEASAFGEPASAAAASPALRWATQPYPRRVADERQGEGAERVEPRDTAVLLFPGQGSQVVGMGAALMAVPAASDLYHLASQVLGWDVARLCTQGPADELDRRCQVAVLVTSLAALERVRDERPAALARVRAVAGFSLGEITALVYAGALPLEAALRLVELRAAAMSAAAADRAGGMLTVWLAPDARLPDALRAACDAAAAEPGLPHPVCQVANYLYPGCKVLAGDEAALRFVERRGGEFGVRRSARVRVEGAFHTPLMARAEAAVRAALAALGPQVGAPRVPVFSCVDARVYRDGAHVRRQLARHVTRAVRWEQTLHALYARPRGDSFPLTLALGPGGSLRATLRQVNARAWDSSLQVQV